MKEKFKTLLKVLVIIFIVSIFTFTVIISEYGLERIDDCIKYENDIDKDRKNIDDTIGKLKLSYKELYDVINEYTDVKIYSSNIKDVSEMPNDDIMNDQTYTLLSTSIFSIIKIHENLLDEYDFKIILNLIKNQEEDLCKYIDSYNRHINEYEMYKNYYPSKIIIDMLGYELNDYKELHYTKISDLFYLL